MELSSFAPDTGLVALVNPLQGTYSKHDFSTGNTLPLIALPHGMTHWTPQTTDPDSRWFFHPDDRRISGIRATHQPSPWIGDYSCFVLMPQTGALLAEAWQRASSIDAETVEYHPNLYRARLLRYNCVLEVAPTERCSVLKTTFLSDEASAAPRRLILDLFQGACEVNFDAERNLVTGFTRFQRGGLPDNYAFYFVIALDTTITSVATRPAGNEHTVAVIELASESEAFTARVGTSFISTEQAERNLATEVGEKTLEEVSQEAIERWNTLLGRIDIKGASETQVRTFYSCLYHVLLFPRKFHELDANGNIHHYSPYDGEIHPGVLYADNGFWDTFRTVYPLLSIAYPDLLGEIIEGWLQAYRESGWLPEWSCPGHRACMIGTHSQVVIADAVTKGITGFDYETALESLIKGSTAPVEDGMGYGREAGEEYEALGYIPTDRINKSTSRTVDYAYDDYCIAQVARVLGREDLYETYLQKSERWRNVFDPETKFFRGRHSDGTWQEPFDPFSWGGAFVEGSAWQFRFSVPHDPAGLAEYFGGPEGLARAVTEMLETPPTFRVGTYGQEIHEITEMAVASFGQYAHSNQPVHHVLFLPAAVGVPKVTREAVHRILNEYYTPDLFPGDEDNGEMGGWYVLGALGLLPLCPGNACYVLGLPLFSEVTITPGDGNAIRLVRDADTSPARDIIVSWNGVPVTGAEIAHADLATGGELRFL